MEILLDTPRVKDLIHKNQVFVLKEAMAQGTGEGMQTFDQAIFYLHKQGRLDYDNALAYADSVNDLRLKIKLDKVGDEEAPAPSEDKLKEKFKLRPTNIQ
ncbi:MAG: hypothetical protein JRC57_02185 [Deltaproteobacteria bacterium]|nr:hypothetical protein [Deltaproteobacteria bacterium]